MDFRVLIVPSLMYSLSINPLSPLAVLSVRVSHINIILTDIFLCYLQVYLLVCTAARLYEEKRLPEAIALCKYVNSLSYLPVDVNYRATSSLSNPLRNSFLT